MRACPSGYEIVYWYASTHIHTPKIERDVWGQWVDTPYSVLTLVIHSAFGLMPSRDFVAQCEHVCMYASFWMYKSALTIPHILQCYLFSIYSYTRACTSTCLSFKPTCQSILVALSCCLRRSLVLAEVVFRTPLFCSRSCIRSTGHQ